MNIEIFEFLEDITNASTLAAGVGFIPMCVAGLSLIAFVCMLYLAFNVAVPLTPTQVLLASIAKMQADSKSLLCSPREIYYQFVSALKIFLKQELRINVDSKMDSEISEIIAQEGLDVNLVAELNDILQRAYQVRFAHLAVDLSILQKDVVWLQKLIVLAKQTKDCKN